MMMGLGLWQEHSSLDGSLLCLALHLKFQTLLNKMQDACRYVNAFARNRSFWRCNHGWGYVSDASRIVDISQYTAWETVLVWHNVVRLTQSINRANDRPTNWSTSHSTGHKAILWRNVQHVVVTANECTDKPDSHSYSHSHSNKKQHAHLSIKTDDLGALSVAFSASPSLSLQSTVMVCQIYHNLLSDRSSKDRSTNSTSARPQQQQALIYVYLSTLFVTLEQSCHKDNNSNNNNNVSRSNNGSNWSDKLQLPSLIQYFYCHFMIITFTCTERTKSKPLLKYLKLFSTIFKNHHLRFHNFYLVV